MKYRNPAPKWRKMDVNLTPHVLVVEDDADLRELCSEILAEAGYAVSEASDGAEGLARLRERRPDLIVLDLRMPRVDGYEFLRRMRSLQVRPEPAVVVVSAVANRRRLSELGPLRLVTKPFEAEVLLDEVRSLLGPQQHLDTSG